MRAWLMAVLLVMGACSGEGAAEDPEPTGGDETPAPEPEPAPEPAPSPPALDPETTCGRALLCCRAFAATIPNVVEETACAGPLEAAETDEADARCEAMSAGWRETLRLAEGEAPEVCGEGEPEVGR